MAAISKFEPKIGPFGTNGPNRTKSPKSDQWSEFGPQWQPWQWLKDYFSPLNTEATKTLCSLSQLSERPNKGHHAPTERSLKPTTLSPEEVNTTKQEIK